jgi:hypothetical protein
MCTLNTAHEVKTDIAEINFPLLPVIQILISSRGFGWWITEIRIYALKMISVLTMAKKRCQELQMV